MLIRWHKDDVDAATRKAKKSGRPIPMDFSRLRPEAHAPGWKPERMRTAP